MKLTPIQTLEAKIRDYPADPEPYLAIISLYVETGREFEAEKLLARGAAATDDPRVKSAWEDLIIQRVERSVAWAQERVKAADTPDSRTLLQQVTAERDKAALEIFSNRAKREPHNAAVRCDLAIRLKQSGKIVEAKKRLEEALADESVRAIAAYELGDCCARANDLAEALRYFRLAAESAQLPRQIETKKLALSHAIGLATRIKLGALARRYLSDLMQTDPQLGAKAAADLGVAASVP